MIRQSCSAALSFAGVLALGILTGCSGPGAPPATATPAAPTTPATNSAAAAPLASSTADQAAYNQAFSPIGDCQITRSRTHAKRSRRVTSESVTMSAGNNGYCTFPVDLASGDVPKETVTAQPQHGSLKFLTLSGQIVVGYQASAGYVGPDMFDISIMRADGLSFPISTQVTVANPAAK
jgi:hypothetical protein